MSVRVLMFVYVHTQIYTDIYTVYTDMSHTTNIYCMCSVIYYYKICIYTIYPK